MANSGGGSPFDIIVSSGAEKLMAGWTMIFSFVWVAWVIGG
jgi:preprotein translocase subunit SecG